MAAKALVILLVGALLASVLTAKNPLMTPGKDTSVKYKMKKLMKECQEEGYAVPEVSVLRSLFSKSWPVGDRKPGQSDGLPSALLACLDSVSGKASPSQEWMADQTRDMMLNSSHLLPMIRQMRNSSAPSVCYIRAFIAPLAWTLVTKEGKYSLEDSDDYDALLWSAAPVLQHLPSSEIHLPDTVTQQKLEQMMRMLQDTYAIWPEKQRKKVAMWVKRQILQNSFNCTLAPSGSTLGRGQACGASANWLGEALPMMGPYLSYVATNDVVGSPSEMICQFFRTGQFKSALGMDTQLKPSLARKLLQRYQECFSGNEFSKNMDKLGVLACYSTDTPDLPPDLRQVFLSQLDQCDNPTVKKVKKKIVRSMISDYNGTQPLRGLGSSVTALSVRQVSMIPWATFKELQNDSTVQWTQGQVHALVNKKLGRMKCKNVSREELMELRSIVRGLPSCVLKQIKAKEILNDTQALKAISKQMRKAQLKALLQGLSKDVGPTELVKKVEGTLLRSVPVSMLARANITSLQQVENKTWRPSQACYLARRLSALKQLDYRRLHSILQGLTCKMIHQSADSDVQDMVQAVTKNPQWISKMQTSCVARKLFETLEKQRANYFQNITEEEMEDIPATLFIHLPPFKLKDLPDSACPAFLRVIERANFSLLPPRSPSRPALTRRTLLCLKKNISTLTTEEVSLLGPLLCDLQPSQLGLMAPAVLNSSLMAMASCERIPRSHRADLVQLLKKNFGDPRNWSPESMEELGPLLLLNDSTITALPNEPWVKDFLYFLKSKHGQIPAALEKKLFLLTTNVTGDPERKKRAADSEGNISHQPVPTVQLIEELELANSYWTAEQLDLMSTETFVMSLETLGNIQDFSAAQLDVLRKKANMSFGPAANMSETVVMQMGCITRGLSNSDLETLPFLLETLEGIGRCGWSEPQMGRIWKAVAKHNNLTVQQLGVSEMVALNGFICGLDASEVGQLEPNSFIEAVDSMDGLQCSSQVLRRLKSLAMSVLKDPSTWTEGQVFDLGCIIAGLDVAELASLNSSVFSLIRESCIPLIPSINFASLSPAQLEAFGPDNAELVTSKQRAALGEEQLAALERASTGSYNQPQPTETSGAPSLSMEGFLAFMKPLLFLLMGFLLL
ncbi:otoancorin [Takifugu rubripes]|nr:otoancorin-like [Takifugu rubripes]